MGRYSFFILVFFIACNRVYAVDGSDNSLHGAPDILRNQMDVNSDSMQTDTAGDSLGIGQKEPVQPEIPVNSEESTHESEKTVGKDTSTIEDYMPDFFSPLNPNIQFSEDKKNEIIDDNDIEESTPPLRRTKRSASYDDMEDNWTIWQNLLDVRGWAASHRKKYNNLVRTVEGIENSYINSDNKLFNKIEALNRYVDGRFGSVWQETGNLWSSMDKREAAMYGTTSKIDGRVDQVRVELGQIWASMDKREAALYGTTSKINGRVDSVRTELGQIWASMDKREAALYGTTSKINGRVDSVRTELGQIWTSMDKRESALNSSVSSVRSELGNVWDSMNKRESALYDTTNKINKRVDGVRTELGQIWTSMDKREKALNTSVASIRTELGNVWDSMDKREAAVYSTVKKGDDAANKRIDNLWTETGNIWNSINKTNTDVSDLHKRVKRLEEFDFSDVGIIAGLALIKDSVDNFKELFDSYFKVDDLTALMAHEGKFVRMIKSQFISLKDFIEKIFSADYWKSYRDMLSRQMENLYTLMAHYFSMDDKESSLYKIRYSIVSGFGELEKLLKLFQTDILGIRTSLNTISSFFETANKRLEMIYDYLKTMKINVNIGDSVNEAGSSLWDVLKALIEALGSILTALVNGLADVIDSISSLAGKLLDMLLKLFVPDNLDFMNKKFDGTGKAFKAKFSFVFSWIDVFKGLFSNQRNLEDITISFGGMFAGGVTLPLSKISEFAPRVRAVITGFILLEFLIDMYKWFHTRGEVIE